MGSSSSSRLYPEITSDEQRQQYKTEFDSDLSRYKSLCADMDELGDRIHQLSGQLDCLDVESIKYQVKDSSAQNLKRLGGIFATDSDHVCFCFSGGGRRV